MESKANLPGHVAGQVLERTPSRPAIQKDGTLKSEENNSDG
jgi:hypothetical protein